MSWWYRRLVYSLPPRYRIPGGIAASLGAAFVLYKGTTLATKPPTPHTFDADYKAAMEDVRRKQLGDPIRRYKPQE